MRWHDASNIYLAIAHYTDLAASLLPPDHLVIKIGRTNNVARRAHKLRKRFAIVEAASVPSGDIARDIESRVLARTRHLVVPSAIQKRLRLPHVSECRHALRCEFSKTENHKHACANPRAPVHQPATPTTAKSKNKVHWIAVAIVCRAAGGAYTFHHRT